MIDHVAVIETKEGKGSIERSVILETKRASVKESALENIHHSKVDVESKENEKVDWQFDTNNR